VVHRNLSDPTRVGWTEIDKEVIKEARFQTPRAWGGLNKQEEINWIDYFRPHARGVDGVTINFGGSLYVSDPTPVG
jgi:hypothetical protein